MYGYSVEETKAIGVQGLSAGIPPYTAEEGRAYIQRAAAGEPQRFEWLGRHRDGSDVWGEVQLRRVTIAGVDRILATARDIGARKGAEAALLRANEELERRVAERTAELAAINSALALEVAEHAKAKETAEEASRAKNEFLSRMSHELRTPMNSILGFAQLLGRADLPTQQAKSVYHILKAGRHLLHLINEVLEIARIEAGRENFSLEPVALAPVLQEALGLVRPLAHQFEVELREGVFPREAFVRADRQRLVQIMLNLLSNAIKYNRREGHVRVTCTADGAGAWVVRVEDSGHGIPAGRAGELFSPFSRLGAEQTDVEGTGLGLALSRRLTEAMGGELSLERTGEDGSVFRVVLAGVPDPLRALEETGGHTAVVAPHREATLLYVEDNLANLSLVDTILLSRPGWRTIPALQGQLGVELAREHLPDVILLDLHLPDIPGDEVLRRLRSDPRTVAIPVIVVSADATGGTFDRLRSAGADAYLTKPIDIDEFLRVVERFLPEPGGRARMSITDRRAALRERLLAATILLVDDEEANLDLLEALLEGEGYTSLVRVDDPRTIMDVVARRPPDVVLLDLHMPHRHGLEVLQELQGALSPDEFLPVLVLTADATPATKERALRAGAHDFLTKPFDTLEVALRVENLLETRLLYADQRRARRAAEEAEARAALLAEWSRRLGASLDATTALAQLPGLLVPRWGDACVVLGGTGDEAVAAAFAEGNTAGDGVLDVATLTGIARSTPAGSDPGRAALRLTTHEGLAVASVPVSSGLPGAGETVATIVLARRSQSIGAEVQALLSEVARRGGLAAERARLFAAAELATRERERLLAVVAHDLRNPLSVVAMYAEMVHAARRGGEEGEPDDGAEDPVCQALATIHRTTTGMQALVEDLLDAATVHEGAIKLHLDEHDAQRSVRPGRADAASAGRDAGGHAGGERGDRRVDVARARRRRASGAGPLEPRGERDQVLPAEWDGRGAVVGRRGRSRRARDRRGGGDRAARGTAPLLGVLAGGRLRPPGRRARALDRARHRRRARRGDWRRVRAGARRHVPLHTPLAPRTASLEELTRAPPLRDRPVPTTA